MEHDANQAYIQALTDEVEERHKLEPGEDLEVSIRYVLLTAHRIVDKAERVPIADAIKAELAERATQKLAKRFDGTQISLELDVSTPGLATAAKPLPFRKPKKTPKSARIRKRKVARREEPIGEYIADLHHTDVTEIRHIDNVKELDPPAPLKRGA